MLIRMMKFTVYLVPKSQYMYHQLNIWKCIYCICVIITHVFLAMWIVNFRGWNMCCFNLVEPLYVPGYSRQLTSSGHIYHILCLAVVLSSNYSLTTAMHLAKNNITQRYPPLLIYEVIIKLRLCNACARSLVYCCFQCNKTLCNPAYAFHYMTAVSTY